MLRPLVHYALGGWLLCLGASIASGKDEIPANLIAGKPVEADAKVQAGTKLIAYYEKKCYLVEIKKIQPNKKLTIVWVESGEVTEDVAPNELYYFGDTTPTRKSKTAALPEAFRARDKNGDGQIGLYEWDRSKYAEFRKLDRNHDGFLTPQELASQTVVTAAVTPTVATPPAVALATNTTAEKKVETKDKPAPANLVEYNDKVDQTFTFTLTGRANGPVWGNGIYSTDSSLAAAAVHAGVLKDGASGTVTVTIVANEENFTGTPANGVTSVERNEAGPAFTIK